MEMTIDLKLIRVESIRMAKLLGVDLPGTLPLLEGEFDLRSAGETCSRLLAMNAVAATAYGYDRAKAIAWLNEEALTNSLSERERCFVFEGQGQPELFRMQIEGMWALAWAVGVAGELVLLRYV